MKDKEIFKNFIDYFTFNVVRNPDKTAIISFDKNITYKKLDEQSDSIANYLLNEGVFAEEIIPLLFDRSPFIVIAMIGVLKSGCAFLPISSFTPHNRRKFILQDSNARFILTNDRNLINNIDLEIEIIYLDELPETRKTNFPTLSSNQLAYLMYTSGSTGNPKGVLIEHGSMMNLFESLILEFQLTENEKILALTDYTFDISLIELIMPLMLGSTVILTEQGAVADGIKIKNYLSKFDISLMQATPITWEILLKQGWKNNGKIKLIVGGERFSTTLAYLLEYHKNNVWNMYGPTETSMWSMCYHLKNKICTGSVPLGHPLANTSIYVYDSNLKNTENGKEGELYIGGKGLARGYLNNPALTKEKFIYHPVTRERLYKTGDIVIIRNDAEICFLGRADEQLKFGGIRIEAGEIENIVEQEPIVKKAIIKTHEQEGYYKLLAAYVEIDEEKVFRDGIHILDSDVEDYFKNIYNEAYLNAGNYEYGEINTCGWKSSFTGELLTPAELKESYCFIEKVITDSDFSEILEVGAGTGCLLSKFSEKANHYTVVEISEKSIEYMNSKLSEKQKQNVIFKNYSITDLCLKKYYSCIIINSVIQYFPSINYLIKVIRKLVDASKSGGTIIIGDVRSLELMEVFILEKLANKTKISNSVNFDLFYYKLRESEIVLSPMFFYELMNDISEISHVDISVKHGSFRNELNYFRYDVVLHIEKSIHYEPPSFINYQEKFDFDEFTKLIEFEKNKPIIIQNIPNLFVSDILKNIEDTLSKFSLNIPFIHDEKKYDDHERSIISSIINIPKNFFEIMLMYDKKDAMRKLEMHIYPKVDDKKIRCFLSNDNIGLYAHSREPFNPWLQKICFDKIKHRVNQNLISWVAPSLYVWMEKWPITLNGKIDRKKLNFTENIRIIKETNSTLLNLQKIWLGITGANIEVENDFWSQGISSLYVHFFLAKINEIFSVNIDYHQLYQYNTLCKLSNYIENL